MKKIIYGLLYGVPALVFGGVSLYFLSQYISEFSYTVNNPYIGFWGSVQQMTVPLVFILLACLYLFYTFKQDYINKFTNWSVVSWYIAHIILVGIVTVLDFFNKPADAESRAFGAMYLAGIVLFMTGLSVITAHAVGLIKRELKPKIPNLILVVAAIFLAVNMGITIYRQF